MLQAAPILEALGTRDDSMESELRIGDWVRSYGSGIWRIYRILELNDFDIPSQSYKSKTIIFSCRFVNDSFKRSFSTEGCDSSFVYRLEQAERDKLDSFINQNQDLYSKFDAYKPKPIDAIYNTNVNIPVSKNQSELESTLCTFQSLCLEQLYSKLLSSDIGSSGSKGWTAQFVSKNHDNIDGKLVYSFSKILAF